MPELLVQDVDKYLFWELEFWQVLARGWLGDQLLIQSLSTGCGMTFLGG